MATIRQKKLARALVDNTQVDKPLNKGELVVSVGYSEESGKKKATEILESKGVQNELIALGFTEDKAKETVAEILVAGEDDNVKLKAADMIFKVQGTYAPEKRLNLNLDGNSSERTKELGTRLLGLFKR